VSPSDPFPAYSYVPGGPWPHPNRSAGGHQGGERPPPIGQSEGWAASAAYLRGIALFNAGYYWEAHEAWEGLWHAHGRAGAIADLLKALIKLAAAGVKVRERQPAGVATHARRAAELFAAAGTARLLGLDPAEWAATARGVAAEPPTDPSPPGSPVACVFAFELRPAESAASDPPGPAVTA